MAEMLRVGSGNTLIELRQSELALKARLYSILDRTPADTIGYAVVDENPEFLLPFDTLLSLALGTRPMLVHDSLSIVEREEMLSSARQSLLPDLRFGISYMDAEMEPFQRDLLPSRAPIAPRALARFTRVPSSAGPFPPIGQRSLPPFLERRQCTRGIPAMRP